MATGDFSSARQALQEADRLRPDYPLPLAMLVEVNLISSDIDSLKQCLLNAAQRFPRDSKLHAELAQDLLNSKQRDLALAEALRADDGAASNVRASMNLAVLENQAGALGDAARLAQLIEQQAGLSETVRASAAGIAGLSYESLGQFPEAILRLKWPSGSIPRKNSHTLRWREFMLPMKIDPRRWKFCRRRERSLAVLQTS